MRSNKPKILVIDLETSPIISYTWGLFDQNVALNQIAQDWHLLSYSAKFLGESKIYYSDQRNAKDLTNDKKLLQEIWKLLDQADIVLGQNSKSFDVKKINARFIINGMQPPSSFKQIDTLQIARKNFGFTSNKLEYMSKTLNTKYKKLTHAKFGGFELWKECLKGNLSAWNEMKKYNIHDVLATEELYLRLQAWDNSIDFNLYSDSLVVKCNCGSDKLEKKGFAYTSSGRFQRYRCLKCGAQTRDKNNLLTKEKKASLHGKV